MKLKRQQTISIALIGLTTALQMFLRKEHWLNSMDESALIPTPAIPAK